MSLSARNRENNRQHEHEYKHYLLWYSINHSFDRTIALFYGVSFTLALYTHTIEWANAQIDGIVFALQILSTCGVCIHSGMECIKELTIINADHSFVCVCMSFIVCIAWSKSTYTVFTRMSNRERKNDQLRIHYNYNNNNNKKATLLAKSFMHIL